MTGKKGVLSNCRIERKVFIGYCDEKHRNGLHIGKWEVVKRTSMRRNEKVGGPRQPR